MPAIKWLRQRVFRSTVMEGFLNPTEILRQLDLRDYWIAADFGCGSGGWVIPLAKRLKEGKVYAIDVLEEQLSVLGAKINSEKIFNIQTIKANVEKGSSLAQNSIDLVIMTNLLFQTEDKKSVLEEGKRVLKSGGKLLVIDWNMGTALGPKEGRISADEIKRMAQGLELKLEKEFEAGMYHYGLVFAK